MGLADTGIFPGSEPMVLDENTGPNDPCHANKSTFSNAHEDLQCDPVALRP